jgi:hypothetical protein
MVTVPEPPPGVDGASVAAPAVAGAEVAPEVAGAEVGAVVVPGPVVHATAASRTAPDMAPNVRMVFKLILL